jgi:RsiW-degrading membrane proteinase PrsW (M82 family)
MIEQFLRHPGVFFLSLFLALIPVLVWAFYFYKKSSGPRKTAVVTFLSGTVAVLPILAYQYSSVFIPDISIHYYVPKLLQSPGWYTTGVFVVAFGVIAYIASIASGLSVILVGIITRTKGIIGNVFRAVREEESNFKIIGLLIAIFASIMIYSGYSAAEAIIITVSLATLEEFVKHLIVRFVDDNRLKSIDDAIEYSILVGLGFAFAENVFYFFNAWHSGAFIQVFIFRSILSVFAHVFFSGVFGYYYGLAHFATPLYHEEVHKQRNVIVRSIHKIFHMKGSVFFHEEKMMQGLLLASILHSIFNYLLQLNKILYIVPFLFFGYFILSYLFDKKEDHKEFSYVSDEKTTGRIHAMKVRYE